MKPVLQVALDLMHLKRALEIAKEAVDGGADWIEAGTPLIKSEGVEALRALKRAYPGYTIVADMKTMDVGGFEVEIAAKAGADVVTVLGLADDATITESVAVARRYGAKVMVDLINVPDMTGRAKRVEELGASYVCLHVGIDEQMRGGKGHEGTGQGDGVRRLHPHSRRRRAHLRDRVRDAEGRGQHHHRGRGHHQDGGRRRGHEAHQGGHDPRQVPAGQFREEVLPGRALRGLRQGLHPQHRRRAAQAGRHGRHSHAQPARHQDGGRALTVQTTKGDWAKPVEAIDRAREGDVIVIDAGGSDVAVWGELASWSAKVRGVAGVVIDGAVRDMDAILDMEFPIFSRHVAPDAGEPKGYGGIGQEIICGEQLVRTGDWIIGDESGVVVVPQERAVEMANRAVDVVERENRIREEIKRGRTLSSVQELEKWEQIR